MNDLIGSIWWMIVSIGVLVTFHEFGHFWVARRFGVKVLRFSVGFGPALWSRWGKDGTQYMIAAIPLGGYVKMLGEGPLGDRTSDHAGNETDDHANDSTPDDSAQAFNRQSVWARIAIVAAGPVANLVLCVALLWGMFVAGRPDYAPIVGHAEGIAAQAGLDAGDTLLAIGDRSTQTWSEAATVLVMAAVQGDDIRLRVRNANGGTQRHRLQLSQLPAEFDQRRAISLIGLIPRHRLLPPVVGRVSEDSAAWGVLAEGDTVTAIDGRPVSAFAQIGPLVQQLGQHGGGMVEVERDGQRLALDIVPQLTRDPERGEYWLLGIAPEIPEQAPAYDAELRYGPIAAVPAALEASWQLARDSLEMIGRMIGGSASVKNVSGPITIARYANASAELGPAWFLNFLALLSLSLAIINLLPIPVLDGGHLLYYLIELIKGSPLSERAMIAGQYVGLVLLAGLMCLAFYNDILQLVR